MISSSAFCSLASLAVVAVLLGMAPTVAAERVGNGLADAPSPYLRDHADDPVDWRPWGPEAFDLARRRGQPVFLSIGFSSCHWCHVMARESFRDPETAAFLNENFICIKVDRDERPDVDQIYMTFVQATTGRGGWPLSVWLTPDGEPFAGGTYFATADRPGRPGFRTVLAEVVKAWTNDRAGVAAGGRETRAALANLVAAPVATAKSDLVEVRARALESLRAEFDPRHGGFGGPPKFPRPAAVEFLFHVAAAPPDDGGDRTPVAMAVATLRAMAAGGIRDQLGGGFHRYATDAAWRGPHFEQLLVDQAQLAMTYLRAFQATNDAAFAATARGLLDSALRDLAAPGGGFHAAIDADSLPNPTATEPEEGAFYRWTRDQIEQVLDAGPADRFCHRYGPEATGAIRGSVLFERHSLAETAAAFGLSVAEAATELEHSRRLLVAARSRRPRPTVDETLITAANGLMISALARGYQLFGDPAYLDAADAAADRMHRDLVGPDGSLGHARQGDGPLRGGFADDYAFLIQGLLDLYEASFDSGRLAQAVALQDRQDATFWDDEAGGYFAAPAGDPLLIVRPKPDRDEAVPSANAVSLANLRRLTTILDEPARSARAERLVAALRGRMEQTPTAALALLVERDRLALPTTHVVIAGQREAHDTVELVEAVWKSRATNWILLLADCDERLAQLSPLVRVVPQAGAAGGKPEPAQPAKAFICTGETCHPPTSDPAEVRRLLDPAAARLPE